MKISNKLHKYSGREIEVTFDGKRCIHAAECIRTLPQVFDTSRVPWVTPDDSAADKVVEAVLRCPTGALHFVRKDGGESEPTPVSNEILVQKDGPLCIRGNIEMLDQAGTVTLRDTRMALCRCGASQNKPFCDNAHRKIKFSSNVRIDIVPDQASEENSISDSLQIQPSPNGPLLIDGEVVVIGSDGQSRVQSTSPALCRCGGSGAKPFCDGSHNRIGFSGG